MRQIQSADLLAETEGEKSCQRSMTLDLNELTNRTKVLDGTWSFLNPPPFYQP